jgi:hypothetical protein
MVLRLDDVWSLALEHVEICAQDIASFVGQWTGINNEVPTAIVSLKCESRLRTYKSSKLLYKLAILLHPHMLQFNKLWHAHP